MNTDKIKAQALANKCRPAVNIGTLQAQMGPAWCHNPKPL